MNSSIGDLEFVRLKSSTQKIQIHSYNWESDDDPGYDNVNERVGRLEIQFVIEKAREEIPEFVSLLMKFRDEALSKAKRDDIKQLLYGYYPVLEDKNMLGRYTKVILEENEYVVYADFVYNYQLVLDYMEFLIFIGSKFT